MVGRVSLRAGHSPSSAPIAHTRLQPGSAGAVYRGTTFLKGSFSIPVQMSKVYPF